MGSRWGGREGEKEHRRETLRVNSRKGGGGRVDGRARPLCGWVVINGSNGASDASAGAGRCRRSTSAARTARRSRPTRRSRRPRRRPRRRTPRRRGWTRGTTEVCASRTNWTRLVPLPVLTGRVGTNLRAEFPSSPAAGEEARDEPAAARAPRNGARKRAAAAPGVGEEGAKGGARSPRAAKGRGGAGGRGARADPPESPGTERVLRKTPERAARVGERHSPRLARKRARGG
jgi:hypothetical protein